MSGHNENARPVCTWVPVQDATGRMRMEAHWGLAQDVHRSQAA